MPRPQRSGRAAVLASLLTLLESLTPRTVVRVQSDDGSSAEFVLPAANDEPGPGASCREPLLELLSGAEHRLTTDQIVAGLEEIGVEVSKRTVERCLQQMVREHRVNNSQKHSPPGWELNS